MYDGLKQARLQLCHPVPGRLGFPDWVAGRRAVVELNLAQLHPGLDVVGVDAQDLLVQLSRFRIVTAPGGDQRLKQLPVVLRQSVRKPEGVLRPLARNVGAGEPLGRDAHPIPREGEEGILLHRSLECLHRRIEVGAAKVALALEIRFQCR